MIEAFHLKENRALIDAKWREKRLLTSEILGCEPNRALQPDLTAGRLRLDLMWKEGLIGIRDEHDGFTEIREPDSAHPRIRGMMNLLLQDPLPVTRAGLRFRYSTQEDLCGLWIDCSNEEIKQLKDEKAWLSRTLTKKHWVVEAGQKGKEFSLDAAGDVLFQEARSHVWLASFDANNDEIPLRSKIHLFSQPGPEVNRAMIACGFELLDLLKTPPRSWAEFGAGYGNLTAAFASLLPEARIWTSEIHPLAVECLTENAKHFFPDAELHLTAAKLEAVESASDLWILDPPRPGFPELFDALALRPELKPRSVLIYHCHSKGLLGDSARLKSLGYALQGWSSVDAFPGTPYHEVISLWNLS
jgi:tRNA/tmRNA/rRNA uracil-C5-methylase (TrmA/RlmC/RlmD family)